MSIKKLPPIHPGEILFEEFLEPYGPQSRAGTWPADGTASRTHIAVPLRHKTAQAWASSLSESGLAAAAGSTRSARVALD